MINALILIDIQDAFIDQANAVYWGERNNPQAERNAARLLAHWRQASGPVIFVRHLSTTPGSPLIGAGAEVQAVVAPLPGEPVLEKSANSAFIGTDLQQRLHDLSAREVTLCGLTTPHCVSTTVRMAANLGFEVTLAHDACAAFTQNVQPAWRGGTKPSAQAIHEAAIDPLHGEFAQALSTDQVLSR
ncbi:cysteine hydrolase family protein [Pontivivens nitratireducens]|uniref:Cysteine hydrolase n=1 Tax=Pontivivens nitratireducens TaxID=2758038 RepID=A0A6G7VPP9_9RHOB|nr:cysteine hydrolase family protein [Pontibrevibacter nitratireducens]QIK41892.1 cysteine hydrolase [Pontibrevibacter nitratireducens]